SGRLAGTPANCFCFQQVQLIAEHSLALPGLPNAKLRDSCAPGTSGNSALLRGFRMAKWQNLKSRMIFVMFALSALLGEATVGEEQSAGAAAKTRRAVVGLDHDHVWSLLKDIAGEPSAELVAIAETDAALVSRAQKEV